MRNTSNKIAKCPVCSKELREIEIIELPETEGCTSGWSVWVHVSGNKYKLKEEAIGTTEIHVRCRACREVIGKLYSDGTEAGFAPELILD